MFIKYISLVATMKSFTCIACHNMCLFNYTVLPCGHRYHARCLERMVICAACNEYHVTPRQLYYLQNASDRSHQLAEMTMDEQYHLLRIICEDPAHLSALDTLVNYMKTDRMNETLLYFTKLADMETLTLLLDYFTFPRNIKITMLNTVTNQADARNLNRLLRAVGTTLATYYLEVYVETV